MNDTETSDKHKNATFKLWGFEATGISGFLLGTLLILGTVIYSVTLIWSLIINKQISLSPEKLGPYKIEQPSPDAAAKVPNVVEQAFHDTNGKALLLSDSATFCALTLVDDDSPKGSCEVLQSEGKWYIKTGGDSGANACKATCLTL